jgi:hypothetical protein
VFVKSPLRNVIQLAVLSVACFIGTSLYIAVFSVGVYNKFTVNLCGQSASRESAVYHMIYAYVLLDKFWEKIKYCTVYLQLNNHVICDFIYC